MRKHMVGSGTFDFSLFHNIAAVDDGCEFIGLNKKIYLIFLAFQRPARAKNRHDDHSLAKILPIA